MVLVWRGAGMFIILAYLLLLGLVNINDFFYHNAASPSDYNWWLPALPTALLNLLLLNWINKTEQSRNTDSFSVRFLYNLGDRHEIFWIPLFYWTFVFGGIFLYGVYGVVKTLLG